MSLLYGKLNKELKLLGSVQTQLHTHVNMFICKPLDYVITNVQNYIQFQLGNIIFRTYQAGNCLFKFEPADFAEGEGKTTSGDFVKSQKVSSIIFNQKVSIILIAQFLANILSKWSLIAP